MKETISLTISSGNRVLLNSCFALRRSTFSYMRYAAHTTSSNTMRGASRRRRISGHWFATVSSLESPGRAALRSSSAPEIWAASLNTTLMSGGV